MATSLFFWEAAAAKFPATAAPAAVFTAGTNFVWVSLAFAGSTADESCYFIGVMPDTYSAAGNITWRLYYLPATGCSEGDKVRWDIGIVGRVDDETFDAAMSDTASVTDTISAGVEADLHIAEVNDTAPTLAPGDLIVVKVTRDQDHGDDDMAEDALFVGLQLLEA